MDIIVCIKQVPDTTDVKINPETNTLVREGVKSIINPFDMYAIEEALRIKEKLGGKITIVTMGPPQAQEAIREAISMGADEGILVSDRAFAGSDTYATSYTIAKAIEKIAKYDIILCGKQASDGDTAQVGPGVSVHLGIPQAAFVRKVEDIKDGKIRLERMTEEGYDVIEVALPCLISVVKEINIPRLPSLKGKMRAKTYQPLTWFAKDLPVDENKLGLRGSPTQVVKIFSPPVRIGGQMLSGDTVSVVEKLAGLLAKDIKGTNN